MTPTKPDPQLSLFCEAARRHVGIRPQEIAVAPGATFPLTALVERVRQRLAPDQREHTALITAELVGVTDTHLRRMIDTRTALSGDRADAWAVRCGYRPDEVWRTWTTAVPAHDYFAEEDAA